MPHVGMEEQGVAFVQDANLGFFFFFLKEGKCSGSALQTSQPLLSSQEVEACRGSSAWLCPLVLGLTDGSSPGIWQAGEGGRVYSLGPSQAILLLIFLNRNLVTSLPVHTLWLRRSQDGSL